MSSTHVRCKLYAKASVDQVLGSLAHDLPIIISDVTRKVRCRHVKPKDIDIIEVRWLNMTEAWSSPDLIIEVALPLQSAHLRHQVADELDGRLAVWLREFTPKPGTSKPRGLALYVEFCDVIRITRDI